MDTNELLLKSISAFLQGTSVVAPRNTDWQELIRKAREEKMLPAVYEALGASIPESLSAFCKKEAVHLIAGQVQRTAEFKSVYKAFAEREIMPL